VAGLVVSCLRAKSIKTRIETLHPASFRLLEPCLRAKSIKTRIETIWEKVFGVSGLKGLRAKSIKTRIETNQFQNRSPESENRFKSKIHQNKD